MTVEEKPDVTYADIGGCKEQIEKMREVVELPMLHPEKFVALGIDPPKGVLCYGPPGTGEREEEAGGRGGGLLMLALLGTHRHRRVCWFLGFRLSGCGACVVAVVEVCVGGGGGPCA